MLSSRETDFKTIDGDFYRCKECETEWYLEWAQEEDSWPIFGLRCNGSYAGSSGHIESAKEDLLVHLLGGKSEDLCSVSHCKNYAVRHTSLCVAHYGFPW